MKSLKKIRNIFSAGLVGLVLASGCVTVPAEPKLPVEYYNIVPCDNRFALINTSRDKKLVAYSDSEEVLESYLIQENYSFVCGSGWVKHFSEKSPLQVDRRLYGVENLLQQMRIQACENK